MAVSTAAKADPAVHFSTIQNLRMVHGHARAPGVRVPRSASAATQAATVSGAIRAHACATPAKSAHGLEKLSKKQADWSGPPNGTVVAIYRNSTGALHGSPLRKGRRSTALRAKDCENLILAAAHARCIGKPLNRMLTVHFDAAGISDPVRATGQLLKLMGDWLRCYNTAITAVWVREAGPQKGEHAHILLSVPPPILRSFTRMQRGWFNKIGAAWKRGVYKSRPIGGSHRAAFSEASTDLYQQALTGALHYLLKGADARARSAHGISKRDEGGELWGKRCGITENIGRAARLRSGLLNREK